MAAVAASDPNVNIRPLTSSGKPAAGERPASSEDREALAARADEIAHLWRLGAETALLSQRLAEFRQAAVACFAKESKRRHGECEDTELRQVDYAEMIARIDSVLMDFAAGSGIHWFQMFKAMRRFLADYPIEEIEGDLPPLRQPGDAAEEALIAWGPELELGVKWIDQHHRGLVDTVNALARLPAWYDPAEADALLERLRRAAWHHFHEEEARLRGGAEANEHVAHHRDLLAELDRLIFDVRSRRVDLQTVVRAQLCDWLVEHIQVTDRRDFGRYTKPR